MNTGKLIRWAVPLVILAGLWLSPVPQGLTPAS